MTIMTVRFPVTGNIVGKPETGVTPSGAQFTKFSLAVDERVRNAETGQWEDGKTLFLNDIVAWRGLAVAISNEYDKGNRVMVDIAMTQDTWEDKESGKKRSKYAFEAKNIARYTFPVSQNGNQGGQAQGGFQNQGAPQGQFQGDQGGFQNQGAPQGQFQGNQGGFQNQGAPQGQFQAQGAPQGNQGGFDQFNGQAQGGFNNGVAPF